MNKAKNNRYLETEAKFEKALLNLLVEKKINEISVKELCDSIPINRVSFYNHYEIVNDVLASIENKQRLKLEGIFKESSSFQDAFINYFQYIKNDYPLFKKMIDNNNTSNLFSLIIPKKIYNNESIKLNLATNTTKYHETFFRAGIAAITHNWLANGCVETPEEMANVIFEEYNMVNIYKERNK